jgi:hypothetical protein
MRSSLADSGKSADQRTVTLRQMTAEQLLALGVRQVAYLRTGTYEGERLFVLYGADGMPLVTVDDIETAVEIAAEHSLEFVTVH